jgi:Glycosyl transferases group 1
LTQHPEPDYQQPSSLVGSEAHLRKKEIGDMVMNYRAVTGRTNQFWSAVAYERKQNPRRAVQRALYHSTKQVVEQYKSPRPKVSLSDQPSAPTVYFLTPDHNMPAGGVRVMYNHVDLLNKVGIEAAVLHQKKGFRCTWFDNTTRVTDIRSSAVGPDDTLVVSELDVDVVAALPRPVRHVVLNQSGYETWARRGDTVAHHYSSAQELLGVMVVSEYSAQMLKYAYPKLNIRRIRNGIDGTRFYPPNEPTTRRICYHPRRGRRELDHVMHMLHARGALRTWDTFSLEGLNDEDFAAEMRSSRITVNLSYWEGFGLTACEAMACGSYVIGFHGFGGREFMRPEFSCPVETGDVIAVAQAIERVIAEDSLDEQWCRSRGQLASSFVLEHYSLEKERESVASAYCDLLALS